MLVWAALPFNEEFLKPVFETGHITFPTDAFTQFYANIDEAIARGKEASDGMDCWIAQVEIDQEDLVAALNDLSFNLASCKPALNISNDYPGIQATIKQKLLYKNAD